MLWVSIFVLKHAELGDDVDVIRFWKCLERSLQDSLGLGEVIVAAHIEEEFDVAGPDLETFEVLLT